jgi:acyl-CoA synthetase (NDP forming)
MIIPGLLHAGFSGRIYPVNPRRREIGSLKCYSSVTEIPEETDLACIIVPSSAVRDVLIECIEKGVKAAIVVTASIDFGDQEEKAKFVETARENGMRICGPNCEGVISLHSGNWATFLTHSSPVKGNISVITESGGIGEFVLHKMWERRIGLASWVSSGNELDLQVADYIEYFATDEETKAMSVFLEGARDGKKFIRAARLAAKENKPIVAMKVGTSEKGKLAVLSHTGALAGAHGVYEGLFRQLGIVGARDVQDMIDLPIALAWQPMPKGDRVGVITDSGGVSALLADCLEEEGLQIPTLSQNTLKQLSDILPPQAKAKNPLDITAAIYPADLPGIVKSVGRLFADDESCDIVVVAISYWPTDVYRETLKSLRELSHELGDVGKPILIVFTAITPGANTELFEESSAARLPLYLHPEKAVKAAKALYRYAKFSRETL